MDDKLLEVISKFKFKGELVEVIENSQGNINSTYLLIFKDKEETYKYLLQKINPYVFKEPYLVMKNIELVTNHIRKKLEMNKDSNHETLTFIKTINDENLCTYINFDGEKEYYRAFVYIDNCISYNNFDEVSTSKEEVSYNAGKCFGMFHRLLSDFPSSMLAETIPNFHNTPNRFNDLLLSIENNVTDRAFEFSKEIVEIISRIKECSVIWENLGNNIPLRVTHNDTKLSNILMDKTTNEGIAVIDLDTIMPGSILFDVGDGIRSACSNSFEDETDKEKIFLNLDLTKSYLKGYLEEMASFLEKEEVTYMGLSIKIIAYELSMRFLTDYINGDTYFKIKYDKHNRDRFINQFTLLKDIENKLDEINIYINDLYNSLI